MLELTNVNVYYGGIHALKNISLKVEEGEVVTLIGANGAGKSTTLKAISGLEKPSNGEIKFNEKKLNSLNPPDIVKIGISHVPEGRRIFSKMSVMENLEMGGFTRKDKSEVNKDYDKVFSLFPRLYERKEQMAGTLSGGEQQMLAIGRALMSRPRLLLLDEPSMGLAPIVVKEIFSIIKDINKAGTTVLLVEQNAHMALNAADRAYIIRNGEMEVEGNAKELLKDEKVKKAYLEG
ncbi:High-affinity branched-chain amino acid transport ATP-binding protein livF LIV-I protein F [Proteiniborus sp. DW1]|uniref:ABC transporter ATP-binding protein n=1 Tax=Proteiniborus sp. DW1 TaxID=1889883 RepID=UPI00092E0A8F|nr:ABC transporter ATP-binding protein [Proteiniborus sp. DW1]SCG84274.1 High-affinity branched-chain amino acid transport ATP-binding protein livF LIV-I protein F [Proteiniborus sp. DW1]